MISYFGAKSKMSKWIYKYIPKDINTYVEPFAGAMWVYTTPGLDYSNVKNIVYNDYNKHMANLFACLKEHSKFLSYIENEIENGFLKTDKTGDEYKQFHKDIFYSYKHDKLPTNFLDNPPKNIPDFDAGVKYAFLLTSTFNGVYPRSGGYSGMGSKKIKLYALINKLKKKEYQDKLDKLTNIHSMDFEELIKKYDSEDTFFYLDPPYFSNDEDGKDTGKRAGWYGVKDSFDQDTHFRLLKMLKTTKSRWALSYYDFPALSEYLPKDEYTWIEKDFFRSSASFSENKSVKGTELLILNYKPDVDFETNDDEPKIDENIKELDKKMKRVVDGINWLPDTSDLVEKMSIEEIVRKKLEEGEKSGIAEDFDKDKFLKEIKEDAKKNGDVYVSEKWVKKYILQIDDKKDEDIDDFWLT